MSRQFIKKMPAACYELRTDSKDLKAIEKRDLVRMLFLLHLIRGFEQKLLHLQEEGGLVYGPIHSSIGQEAIAAASGVVLRKTDMLGSSHRAHGHFLAKACMYYAPDDYDPIAAEVPPAVQTAINRTMAEIMGLAPGWCKGRGGSMHLYDGASGNLGSNGIVGGGIPIATGAAWAEKIQGRDAVVVSFFGDGAINQGCFHEVANLGALWNVPVVFFVENNAFAVGTPTERSSYLSDLGLRGLSYGIEGLIVDGMDPVAVYTALAAVTKKMRQYPFPYMIEGRTYRYYHHSGSLPGSVYGYRSKEEEAAWRARDPVVVFPQSLVEAGLISSTENEVLLEKSRACVETAVDFSTAEEDGKRYIPMERWPRPETVTEDLRGPEDRLSGLDFVEKEHFNTHRTMTYVEAVAAATLRSMERDERVYVLGEEVANFGGGAYQATKGIPKVFPERVLNTPISECGFVGLAAGGACRGLRPVVEIMYPDFTLVAADQLFNQIGKLRHMYGGHIRFPLVLRTCIAQGGYGGQHSMAPAGLFALFSGWRIVAPSTPFDYIGLFNTAMAFDDPVLIVEHRTLYPIVGEVPSATMDYFIKYGKAKVVRGGEDLTVLTYLTGVTQCLTAAEDLARQGISVEVIDLRTLDYLGMDYRTIGDSVKKTHSVLIVEFSPRSLGIAARLSDEIQEKFFDDLDCPVAKLTAPDIPPPVSRPLEESTFPSIDRIKDCMIQGSRHCF
jgi:2-oxoisovalerate dehydrogenase E1 component